jgi:hypothetical protein
VGTDSGVRPQIKIAVNHAKEFRLALLALVLFWAAAAVFAFLAWHIPAFWALSLGTMAASERLLRIATQGSSRQVRIVARCLMIMLFVALTGAGYFVLSLPHRP